MTITAPPRPPRPSDPVDRDELEALVNALIEEARRRARRRRRIYAGFGILAAFAGAAVFTILERTAQSQTASPAPTPRPGSSLASAKPRLAFVSTARGSKHAAIYVMNADGSERRRVTAYTGWGADLVWSPDGNQLAFTRGYPWTADIYVVRTDGSGVRRLTRDPANEAPKAWSPDGRKIVLGRWYREKDSRNGLYVMDADGSSVHRLGPTFSGAGSVAWSPEGRRIAFVGPSAAGSTDTAVYVAKANGSDLRKLTDPAPDLGSLSWSPDGRNIAFMKRAACSVWPRCGSAEIWVTNADGSERRRVAAGGIIESALSWSPDGRLLVFARKYRPHPNNPKVRYLYVSEIFRVNADGSGKQRLTNGGQPLWSPDGDQIAFVRWPGGRGELYLMNPDGSGQRRITSTPGYGELTYAWSPGRAK